MLSISSNIREIQSNIEKALRKFDRDKNDINFVCVTKKISSDYITEAIRSGIKIIGESRVEEAKEKKDKIPAGVMWHLVGHLRARKVKDAVKIFDLIHSVDTVRLAKEINKRAEEIGKIQEILLEVNVSEEETKYGFRTEDLGDALKEIKIFPNVRIMGLMTMAPLSSDPEMTRPVFKGLKELSDGIQEEGIELKYLSMGMTQDYVIAIEEGSNMVRIGTAVFKGV